MPYIVKLKAGHPTGTYRRSGLEFTPAGRELTDDEMTRAIKKDPWLDVTATKEEKGSPKKK